MMFCLFCKIAAKEIPASLRHEDDTCIAFDDIYPKAPTHVLVVPKRHIESVNALTSADATLVGRLVLVAQAIAQDAGIAERGYKLVVNCGEEGGQVIPHLHVHLLGGKPL
ncbi:histidine triad nucleotide-binding protein [Candidatus Uhrbacteria bacterium]|nr:histidine triad nucleotide-binding protein [Candidatus Uhrbacteria bacterium]